MAKRKRSKDSTAPIAASSPGRINIGIENAENGAVVHLSSEGMGKKGGYISKTLVAPDHAHAMRIATAHIATMGPKLKKKAGKKGAKKRTLTKV
jgi:hypothetical protein